MCCQAARVRGLRVGYASRRNQGECVRSLYTVSAIRCKIHVITLPCGARRAGGIHLQARRACDAPHAGGANVSAEPGSRASRLRLYPSHVFQDGGGLVYGALGYGEQFFRYISSSGAGSQNGPRFREPLMPTFGSTVKTWRNRLCFFEVGSDRIDLRFAGEMWVVLHLRRSSQRPNTAAVTLTSEVGLPPHQPLAPRPGRT